VYADISKMISGKRMPLNQEKRGGIAGDVLLQIFQCGVQVNGDKKLDYIALPAWVGVICYHRESSPLGLGFKLKLPLKLPRSSFSEFNS